MFHNGNDHEVVSRLAEADRCLILELTASHGLEFATAFRVDFATEVARAMWSIANRNVERYATTRRWATFNRVANHSGCRSLVKNLYHALQPTGRASQSGA